MDVHQKYLTFIDQLCGKPDLTQNELKSLQKENIRKKATASSTATKVRTTKKGRGSR